MPAKKKAKKGAKKKGADKDEDQGDAVPEISVLDKTYYLSQIQALEVSVERVTQRCEQVTQAELHARDKYRTLHREKKDIVAFLRERLKSKEDEIEEFRNRLLGLVKSTKEEKEVYEERLKAMRTELDLTTADLSDKILSLTRKLESLEEFRLQKEEIDEEHAALKALLEAERGERKEKVALLERSFIEERQALVSAQKARLVVLREELREAARKEVHETTRTALVESQTQFKAVTSMKTKILKLRQENVAMSTRLREQLNREAVLQDSLEQMTSISERRAVALRKVVQKAIEHSGVSKEFAKLQEEKDSLRRDLQQTQVQLDAATRISCDIRENSSEKTVALELLSAKLHEEQQERVRVTNVLQNALQMLQETIFARTDDSRQEMKTESKDILNVALKHLVDILSEAEQTTPALREGDHTTLPDRAADRRDDKSKALVTYSAGDLGLVPKTSAGRRSSVAPKRT